MEDITMNQFVKRMFDLYPDLKKEAEIQYHKEKIIREKVTKVLLEFSRLTCEMIEKSGKH